MIVTQPKARAHTDRGRRAACSSSARAGRSPRRGATGSRSWTSPTCNRKVALSLPQYTFSAESTQKILYGSQKKLNLNGLGSAKPALGDEEKCTDALQCNCCWQHCLTVPTSRGKWIGTIRRPVVAPRALKSNSARYPDFLLLTSTDESLRAPDLLPFIPKSAKVINNPTRPKLDHYMWNGHAKLVPFVGDRKQYMEETEKITIMYQYLLTLIKVHFSRTPKFTPFIHIHNKLIAYVRVHRRTDCAGAGAVGAANQPHMSVAEITVKCFGNDSSAREPGVGATSDVDGSMAELLSFIDDIHFSFYFCLLMCLNKFP
ncbi:hypothetical protein EVAR_103888_1 [Eumeta japonica]|uniref:Uncharacterized protein n=1 Tax=Eumeta variegata TaxID=151549 RepID=A0A4C1ZN51_EUMVA|nr:hypothetical protein EVAR_103888_1 [Eumeta japonica]